MSIELFLYLIDISSNISALCDIALCILLFFAGLYTLVGFAINENANHLRNLKGYYKYYFIPLALCSIICALTPSQKTFYLIIGAHYLKSSDLPSKVELIIEKKLDEYLIDISKDELKK